MEDNGIVRLTVRLPQDVHDRVRLRAEKNHNSLNGEFIRLLVLALDNKLALLPNFWDLTPEKRVEILLDGFGRHVTQEAK